MLLVLLCYDVLYVYLDRREGISEENYVTCLMSDEKQKPVCAILQCLVMV